MILLIVLLLALWTTLCRHLGLEWSINEQYNYGWFVPFLALYLFWLRWEKRPPPMPPSPFRFLRALVAALMLALFLLFPIRLFEVANPDWRPLGWIHAAVVALVTLTTVWGVGGKSWLRQFFFPVAFFFVAVPWMVIEDPIVHGLMRVVAIAAAEVLTWFGIPTQVEGGLIRVNTGVVGINEACSGVRSLQTSLMIGLLFGEMKKFRASRRLLLVLAAVAIALLANFCRAFFLVWVAATQSISATERWHDLAGYLIVGVVFFGSLFLAKLLSPPLGETIPVSSDQPNEFLLARVRIPFSTPVIAIALCWLVAVEVAVEAWYRSHEKATLPSLKWSVIWPESAPGFREISIDKRVKETLHFDRGREAMWSASLPDETADAAHWIMFFFRWEPGTSPIIRARSHRPDTCLPQSGWRQTGDAPVLTYSIGGKLALAFRHLSFVRDLPGQPKGFAHVFFCTYEDILRSKQDPGAFDPGAGIPRHRGIANRVKVVRAGIRSPGLQVLEPILISAQPIDAQQAEKQFFALLPNIISANAPATSSAAR